MTPEQARAVLRAATWEDQGTFTLLRLWQDPGKERVHELRLALRVLWRNFRVEAALPHEIARDAAFILLWQSDIEQYLQANPRELRREMKDIEYELADVALGAFELLSGPVPRSDMVRRRDLGE